MRHLRSFILAITALLLWLHPVFAKETVRPHPVERLALGEQTGIVLYSDGTLIFLKPDLNQVWQKQAPELPEHLAFGTYANQTAIFALGRDALVLDAASGRRLARFPLPGEKHGSPFVKDVNGDGLSDLGRVTPSKIHIGFQKAGAAFVFNSLEIVEPRPAGTEEHPKTLCDRPVQAHCPQVSTSTRVWTDDLDDDGKQELLTVTESGGERRLAVHRLSPEGITPVAELDLTNFTGDLFQYLDLDGVQGPDLVAMRLIKPGKEGNLLPKLEFRIHLSQQGVPSQQPSVVVSGLFMPWADTFHRLPDGAWSIAVFKGGPGPADRDALVRLVKDARLDYRVHLGRVQTKGGMIWFKSGEATVKAETSSALALAAAKLWDLDMDGLPELIYFPEPGIVAAQSLSDDTRTVQATVPKDAMLAGFADLNNDGMKEVVMLADGWTRLIVLSLGAQ